MPCTLTLSWLGCVLKNWQFECFKSKEPSVKCLLPAPSDLHHCSAVIKLEALYLLRHCCLILSVCSRRCFPFSHLSPVSRQCLTNFQEAVFIIIIIIYIFFLSERQMLRRTNYWKCKGFCTIPGRAIPAWCLGTVKTSLQTKAAVSVNLIITEQACLPCLCSSVKCLKYRQGPAVKVNFH